MKLRFILNELDGKPKLPTGRWVQPTEEDLQAYKDELFDMIQKSYAYIVGITILNHPLI